MPRWEPNGRLRLVEAALDLFEEHGYDSTSVKQIAERAGLTKATFFRQFADKREVLSAGQDEHSRLLREEIAQAPATAGPSDAVRTGLAALARTFTPDRRAFAARVHAVAALHAELRERSGLKYAGYYEAMREALVDRDVPPTTAAVAADLGLLAFRTAFEEWTTSNDDLSLEDHVLGSLSDVLAAVESLSSA